MYFCSFRHYSCCLPCLTPAWSTRRKKRFYGTQSRVKPAGNGGIRTAAATVQPRLPGRLRLKRRATRVSTIRCLFENMNMFTMGIVMHIRICIRHRIQSRLSVIKFFECCLQSNLDNRTNPVIEIAI